MSNETKTPSVAGSEDDWETADFSNIAQTKPRQPSTTSDQAANLRPSAPTFQPRTSKPPTPRLWEPEPPVAPSGSRLAGSGQVAGGTGTGRSVLLGPAIEVKGSASSSGDASGRTRSAQEGSQRSIDQDRSTPSVDPAQPLPGMSPGSVIPSSSSGSTIRAPTILMRRDRESVGPPTSTTLGPSGSSNSPFGDDDEWNRDPRTVVVPNSQLWEQANNSAPMPDLPKNAPAMPTAASLRILRRPSPATSASSSNFNQNQNNNQNEGTGSNGSVEALNEHNQNQRDGGFISRGSPGAGGNGSRSGSRRNKTLIEREEEYKRARERIFGTTEGAGAGPPGTGGNAGPGPGETNVPDNRSEVSGCDSGAATPARSGSSSTGSLVSAATSAAPGPITGTGTPQGQNPAQTQSRSGSVGPGSSTSSSSRIRTGPTQSSKRRGESHFEPLRPPTSGQAALQQGGTGSGVGGLTGPFLPSSTGSGMGYPRGATRDRFNASGYGPMGMYQTYEPAPYGMGLSGGMPYQGTALQQQQGQQQQPGGYAMYSQMTGYQSGQMQGQQSQLGLGSGGQGGYGRMSSGGSVNGYQAGPMRQPIGPGDVEGMGFGQLRLNDAMPYGGRQGNQGYADGWQHGPPRPAYSSSSSSASSDVGSTGGYPHESMYRAGGAMPPPQQQMHQHPYTSQPQPGMMYNNNKNNLSGSSSSNSLNGSSNNLSHMHGMEQPQPGYMGGRAGPGAYGQGWPASRQGSGGDGSSDAGYPR